MCSAYKMGQDVAVSAKAFPVHNEAVVPKTTGPKSLTGEQKANYEKVLQDLTDLSTC